MRFERQVIGWLEYSLCEKTANSYSHSRPQSTGLHSMPNRGDRTNISSLLCI